MEKKQAVSMVLGGIVALFAAYGLGVNKGYMEGRNEGYTIWQGANGLNRAYGSWKFVAECEQLFNKTGVEWEETTVPGLMVKKDEGTDRLTILMPNFEQVDIEEPKPTEQMKKRAKRLQEALCTENDQISAKDPEGYYDGTAYTFTLNNKNVSYHTEKGKARGFYIPPTTSNNRITVITPYQKSNEGEKKTAEAFAYFLFPNNEIDR